MSDVWVKGIDALSGVRLLINTAHIVALRESRTNTFVVTSCGLEYEVEGAFDSLSYCTLRATTPTEATP